jgi:hypothetical protein
MRMTKLVLSFAIALMTAAGIDAQQPTSSPPAPRPASTPAPQPVPNVQSRQRANAIDRGYLNFPLNPVSESDRLSTRVTRLAYWVAPLYKRPGGKEISAILPDKALVQKYSEFLKLPDTGLVRLVPDSGCVYSERVVNVREECLKYPFPGAGNSYSFRTDGYRLRHLADITYVDDKLRMTGIFMHGIAVDLGNVPIESASLMTEGMRFLAEFKPSTEPDDVILVDQHLKRGVSNGNFVYSKEVDPMADRTYAIRSVAYRGKVVRSAGGIRYNELEYDKRRDVIVVFRIVDLNDEGITILWRKLADSEPPRIKMPKPEKDDEKVDDNEAN